MRYDDSTTKIAHKRVPKSKRVSVRRLLVNFVASRVLHQDFLVKVPFQKAWGSKEGAKLTRLANKAYQAGCKVVGPPGVSRFVRSALSPNAPYKRGLPPGVSLDCSRMQLWVCISVYT